MITTNLENETLHCSFTGRLDTLNCAAWENGFLEKINKGLAGVVFDMKEVDYIASCFLRICVQVAQNIGGDKFSIINVQPPVKKVFKLSAFDKLFSIK